MDIAFIRQLIELHERSAMVEIEYIQGDQRLRLCKTNSMPQGESLIASRTSVQGAEFTENINEISVNQLVDYSIVKSPLSGVFHRRPSPNEPTYINENDIVEEGQMIGIVEAMKVLNSIDSEFSGRVVEFLVEDGAAVEAGTPLLRIDVAVGRNV